MRRIVIAAGLALLAVGCTRAPGAPDRSPESPRSIAAIESAGPTLPPTPPSTAAPTLAPLPSDLELRHTVELRRAMGLRSDLEWIAAVAADPRASTYALAIPLLPEEEADVTARTEEAAAVVEVVTAYAASHPDEFGGIYVDHASRAGVVTLWTAHLAEHEAAIRAQLEPGWRVEFRAVRFSERYLRGLQDRISADLEWMAAIPAQAEMVAVDVINNHAWLKVSSANREAVRIIEDHFSLGEALLVESDGTGVVLVPWGEVAGRVRTAAGDSPDPADYNLRWRSSDLRRCGIGDVGYGLAEDGTFTLPCQAGVWTIAVEVPDANDWRSIGEGTVTVRANATADLEIVLTGAP